jgi:hypothetical protein
MFTAARPPCENPDLRQPRRGTAVTSVDELHQQLDAVDLNRVQNRDAGFPDPV